MAGYAFPDEELYSYRLLRRTGSFKYRWGFTEGVS